MSAAFDRRLPGGCRMTGVSLSAELMERVDRFIQDHRRATGFNLGRSELVRVALAEYLDRRKATSPCASCSALNGGRS